MLEELRAASGLLRAALGRYIKACSALKSKYSYKGSINDTTGLLDSITNELDLVESYKSGLTEAQAAVKRARNNSAKVSISSLPFEVLVYIFHLVLAEQACLLCVTNRWHAETTVPFPRYPDILSHVCSRWRRIALATSTLWSHIDISLSYPASKGFHERATAHAIRAGHAPLDIHFIDRGDTTRPESSTSSTSDSESEEDSDDVDHSVPQRTWNEVMRNDNPAEFAFLISPVSHIRSLGLTVRNRYHPINNRALEYCLSHCQTERLSELVISVFIPSNPIFIKFGANPHDRDAMRLVLPEQVLERALSSITVLNLEGIYFPWTSTAYHGLTELRLLGREDISALELAGILQSSPQLRIIHCDFDIVSSHSSSTSPSAVALPELEVLELGKMAVKDVERFIQLLNPGPKPLRLSFHGDPTSAIFQAFYARSNVQELRIGPGQMMSTPRSPLSPFCLPPQLRVLLISDWSSFTKNRGAIPPIRLDTLYMLGCCYESDQLFHEIVAHFSPRRLVLWRCGIGGFEKQGNSLSVFESALGDDLSESCSIEYVTDQGRNPVQDWQCYRW